MTAVLLAAGPLDAAPAAAGESYPVFAEAPVRTPVPAAPLNGSLSLGGLSGGVGNTYGAICCTGGTAVVAYGVPRRQGGAADIAFRAARDTAFANPFSGPATDRAFRFRANAFQAGRR